MYGVMFPEEIRPGDAVPTEDVTGTGGAASESRSHAPHARFSPSNDPPIQCMSSLARSSVAHTAQTARRLGASLAAPLPAVSPASAATCSAMKPPQEHPIMPTAPVHHG